MAVYAAIDDEAGADDCCVMPAPGQQHGMQRYFERARYLEIVDIVRVITMLRDFGREGGTTAVDDFLVPAGLHEGDAPGLLINALIHGGSSPIETRIRT
jgi:hypothetical protein